MISVNVSQFFKNKTKIKRKRKRKTKTTRLPIGEDGQFYGNIYLFSLFTLLYFIKLKKGCAQGFVCFFLF